MSKLYFIINKSKTHIKIGKAQNPKQRLRALQTGSWEKLRILKTVNLKTDAKAFYQEGRIHKHFKKYRVHGEWFKFNKEIFEFMKSYTGDIDEVQENSYLGWVVFIVIIVGLAISLS